MKDGYLYCSLTVSELLYTVVHMYLVLYLTTWLANMLNKCILISKFNYKTLCEKLLHML